MTEEYQKEFGRLVEIIDRLRGPDGCPWDRKQTHSSLKEFLLEESYEVLEALDEEDPRKLYQELGDLLLQIVLHARIASENAEFTLEDVLKNINTKLIRRHPHIFGDVQVNSAAEVSQNWEAIKKTERDPDASILDSVPAPCLPWLIARISSEGLPRLAFDWQDTDGVIDKLAEEVTELKQADTPAGESSEFGDILFTLVNVARRMGIDPEASLRQANRKFYRRFSYMEKLCKERGLNFSDLSFDEQNKLWDEAKAGVD